MRLMLIATAATLLLAALPARSAPDFICPLPSGRTTTPAEIEAWCRSLKAQAAACAAKDGDWHLPGLSPPGTIPTCILSTPDAGKACTSNEQCRQSACVPDHYAASGPTTGHCDKYGLYPSYCRPSVDHGRVVTPPPCPVI